MKMQTYCPAMKGISQASILYEFELVGLFGYTKNQWDKANPAPTQISHKSLPLWLCIHSHGKHDRWLGMPGKESLLLVASKTFISPCQEKQHFCVLRTGGARRDMRCEVNRYEHTSSPCPRSSRDNPSSLWKSIERPPHQKQ